MALDVMEGGELLLVELSAGGSADKPALAVTTCVAELTESSWTIFVGAKLDTTVGDEILVLTKDEGGVP